MAIQGNSNASDVVLGADAIALVERLPDAVAIANRAGKIISLSPSARAIFSELGNTDSDSADRKWTVVDRFGRALDVADMPAEVTRRTGRECKDVEVGHRSDDGVIKWLRISSRRLDDVGPPYAIVASVSDVSHLHTTLAELSRANHQFAQAFGHAPIGMALVSLDGRFERVNGALCEIVGYTEHQLLELTFQEITHPADLELDLRMVDEILAGQRTSYQIRKRYLRADNHEIWVQLSVALVTDDQGNPVHFISQLQDVTERRMLEQRLQQLADRDHLTGMLNRRRFEEELSRQIDRCARHEERAALMLLDIDHFKHVNDTAGHIAGDELLRTVSDVLSRRVRASDLVARVGGDEFAAILVDCDEDGAMQLGGSLISALREFDREGVTASAGVALIAPGDTIDAVLARADRALYFVKNSGRDGVALDSEVPVPDQPAVLRPAVG